MKKSDAAKKDAAKQNFEDNKSLVNSAVKLKFEDMRDFWQQNAHLAAFIPIFILLGYGGKLFMYTIQFDTSQMKMGYEWNLEWFLRIGRFSLVAMKRIFENGFLNVNYSNYMALLFYCLSIFVWAALLFGGAVQKGRVRYVKLAVFTFMALFATTPVMAEQFSFSLQNWEVMSGFITTAGGVWAFYLCEGDVKSKRDWLFMALAALSLAWSLGLYQSFAAIFALGVFSVRLFRTMSVEDDLDNAQNRTDFKDMGLWLLRLVICAALSIVFYLIINSIVLEAANLEADSYLFGNVKWNTRPFAESFQVVLDYIKNLVWSRGNYYQSKIYGTLLLAFIIGAVYHRPIVQGLILRAAIAASPFYLPILFGNSIMLRMQIVLPLAIAIAGSVFVMDLGKFKRTCLPVAAAVILLIFSLRNAQILNQAFHTEYISYNYDAQKCYQIDHDIKALPELNGLRRIAFIGRAASKGLAPDGFTGENIGGTYFQLSWLGNEGMSGRVTDFMNTLGLDYQRSWSDEYNNIYNTYESDSSIPAYPAEGSIFRVGDVIVVKLY